MLSIDLISSVLAEIQKPGGAETARKRLEQLRNTLARPVPPIERFGPRRGRGRSFYDDLVNDMLALVRSAGSREALTGLAMDRLSEESEDRVGLGYLLVSARPSGSADQLAEVRLERAAGFAPGRVEALFDRDPRSLVDSALLRSLLIDRSNIDFTPLGLVRGSLYRGEFDRLTDHSDRVWLAAVALPAFDARQPNQALLGLFRAIGDPDQPTVPRGAAQEWRALEFLRLAYDLLNHQLASVAEQREAQRRDLLADLAPGIVNHEINQQVRILLTGTHAMNLALRELPAEVKQHGATGRLVDALKRQYGVLDRLERIASAFNNLGKQTERSAVQIAGLVAETESLLGYRIARHGVNFQAAVTPPDLVVETDAALLEHVLLNLMMNALDAFEGAPSEAAAPPQTRLLRVDAAVAEKDGILVRVLNNGPAIGPAVRQRIFDRGFSTKPRGKGHGLGLFICRLVTTYVGGRVDLVPDEELPPDSTIGFQVWLPRVAPALGPLAEEGTAEDPGVVARRLRERRS